MIIKIDKTPPEIISQQNINIPQLPIEITINASDNYKLDEIVVYLDNNLTVLYFNEDINAKYLSIHVKIDKLDPGIHMIVVKALDYAGNIRILKIILSYTPLVNYILTIVTSAIVIAIISAFFIIKRRKGKR